MDPLLLEPLKSRLLSKRRDPYSNKRDSLQPGVTLKLYRQCVQKVNKAIISYYFLLALKTITVLMLNHL